MKKDDNKTNKNIITEEQHKARKLFWIGMVSISLLIASKAFSTVSITLANIAKLSAFLLILGSIFFILFTVLFLLYVRDVTFENLKFRIIYLSILFLLFLEMIASYFSFFLTPESIKAVGESLVVATTLSFLIGIEFYKHMEEYTIKLLKDQKTKRDRRRLIIIIIETFEPMIFSILALFLALVVLMTFLEPYSFIFIDMSILSMLFGLIIPIGLLADDLLTQVFKPSKERK